MTSQELHNESLYNWPSAHSYQSCCFLLRTFQEEELIKAKVKNVVRSDMYQKMVKIDPSAPSAEEHAQKGVTKSRYLQWRDATSSTSLLGFRIEGLMVRENGNKAPAQLVANVQLTDVFMSPVSQMEDGSVQRDFRNTLTLAQVTEALLYFTRSQLDILVRNMITHIFFRQYVFFLL